MWRNNVRVPACTVTILYKLSALVMCTGSRLLLRWFIYLLFLALVFVCLVPEEQGDTMSQFKLYLQTLKVAVWELKLSNLKLTIRSKTLGTCIGVCGAYG